MINYIPIESMYLPTIIFVGIFILAAVLDAIRYIKRRRQSKELVIPKPETITITTKGLCVYSDGSTDGENDDGKL